METVEVLIKIPKDIYKRLDDPFDTMWEHYLVPCAYAIRNGTVLPKGHGKLIDADKLKERCLFMSNDDTAIEGVEYVTKGMIENAHAIIEADKEE